MMAKPGAKINAPPGPWTARATTSIGSEIAAPHTIEPSVNSARPVTGLPCFCANFRSAWPGRLVLTSTKTTAVARWTPRGEGIDDENSDCRDVWPPVLCLRDRGDGSERVGAAGFRKVVRPVPHGRCRVSRLGVPGGGDEPAADGRAEHRRGRRNRHARRRRAGRSPRRRRRESRPRRGGGRGRRTVDGHDDWRVQGRGRGPAGAGSLRPRLHAVHVLQGQQGSEVGGGTYQALPQPDAADSLEAWLFLDEATSAVDERLSRRGAGRGE